MRYNSNHTNHTKGQTPLPKKVAMPTIPRPLMNHNCIRQVLYLTIDDFNYEEKRIIYLYCIVELSIGNIVKLTKLSALYVIGTLLLYSERLAFKLGVFNKTISYDVTDLATIKEMFELENEEEELFCKI